MKLSSTEFISRILMLRTDTESVDKNFSIELQDGISVYKIFGIEIEEKLTINLEEILPLEASKIELIHFHIMSSKFIDINFENSIYESLEIKNCHFNSHLKIYNCAFKDELIFEECTIEGTFIIECNNSEVINNITFAKNKFKNTIQLSLAGNDNILIENNSILKNIEILSVENSGSFSIDSGNHIGAIKFISEKVCIQDLNIKSPDPFTLTVENSRINRILLASLNLHASSKLIFYETQCNNLKITDFFNYGLILFKSIKPLINNKFEEITINSSFLGDVRFVNCKFQSCNNFTFSNSSLAECTLIETEFPLIINEAENKSIDNKDVNQIKSSNVQLFHSQLKQIFEKSGDLVNSNKHHAAELENYRLKLQGANKAKIFGLFKLLNSITENKIRHTKSSLWASRYTSNYGENWLLGLIIYIFCGIVGYIFYIFSFILCCNNLPVTGFNEWLSGMIQFLFPLRNLTEFNGLEVNGIPMLIDLIFRIILSFIAYQTIQAFRRYGHRSL